MCDKKYKIFRTTEHSKKRGNEKLISEGSVQATVVMLVVVKEEEQLIELKKIYFLKK